MKHWSTRNAAVAMAIILLSCCALVCRAEAAVLLDENFDGYPTGQPPVPPWEEHYRGCGGPDYSREEAAALGVTIQVDDAVAVSGKSLHLLDTSSGVGSDLSLSFSQTSHVVLEYRMQSHNNNYEGVFVNLVGDVGTDYAVCFGNGCLGGGHAGQIGVMGWYDGWIEPDLLPYREDTWYYVRRELDCIANSGGFYVEELVEELGNPANNSAFYSVGSDCLNIYIDSVKAVTSCSQGADAHVDDIFITPEPATLSLLGLGGLTLLLRKRR